MVKNIIDSLSVVSCPVVDSYLVSVLLGGLPYDYNVFVTLVNTHVDPVGLDELVGMLIS